MKQTIAFALLGVVALFTGCLSDTSSSTEPEPSKSSYGQALGSPLHTARTAWFAGPLKQVDLYAATCPQGPLGMCQQGPLISSRFYGSHGGLTFESTPIRSSKDTTTLYLKRLMIHWKDNRISKITEDCLAKSTLCPANLSPTQITEFTWLDSTRALVTSDQGQIDTLVRTAELKWEQRSSKPSPVAKTLLTFDANNYWIGITQWNAQKEALGTAQYKVVRNPDGSPLGIQGSGWLDDTDFWDETPHYTLNFLERDLHGNSTLSQTILRKESHRDTTYQKSTYLYWE